MERKHTDSSVKKKFMIQGSVKKVMRTVLCGVNGLITIDFLEKGAAVNSAFYR